VEREEILAKSEQKSVSEKRVGIFVSASPNDCPGFQIQGGDAVGGHIDLQLKSGKGFEPDLPTDPFYRRTAYTST
jgi:hypothetical protein